jgi:hypothetical protein
MNQLFSCLSERPPVPYSCDSGGRRKANSELTLTSISAIKGTFTAVPLHGTAVPPVTALTGNSGTTTARTIRLQQRIATCSKSLRDSQHRNMKSSCCSNLHNLEQQLPNTLLWQVIRGVPPHDPSVLTVKFEGEALPIRLSKNVKEELEDGLAYIVAS